MAYFCDVGVETVPDDVLTALEYLRRNFPFAYHHSYVEPPLILVSQVYALVEDRTLVDRRIRELIERRRIVVFDIPAAGVNERALLFLEDYRAAVLALVPPTATSAEDDTGAAPTKRRRRDAESGDDGAAILSVFAESVIPSLTSSTITDAALINAFTADQRTANLSADAVRAAVIGFGLIVRHRTIGTYYVTAPHTSHIIGDVLAGRQALSALIRRRRSRQIGVDQLQSVNGGRLAKSQRGTKWTLLDMIGTRRIHIQQTDRARIVTLAS